MSLDQKVWIIGGAMAALLGLLLMGNVGFLIGQERYTLAALNAFSACGCGLLSFSYVALLRGWIK